MMSFFEVLILPRLNIREEEDATWIDLRLRQPIKTAKNNSEIHQFKGDEDVVWLSGGGSIVVSQRYLPLVLRNSKVPDKRHRLSLFTGRADNPAEWLTPESLVRELFEELLISIDGKPVWPQNANFQHFIDPVLEKRTQENRQSSDDFVKLNFTSLNLPSRKYIVQSESNTEKNITIVEGKDGDWNVVFLFQLDVDIDRLTFDDGEYLEEKGSPHLEKRVLCIYDLEQKALLDRHLNQLSFDWNDLEVSPHTEFVITELARQRAGNAGEN